MADTRIRRSRSEIAITSAAFQDGARIPGRYARAGENRSPALHWSRLPQGSASVALVCEDPDAPQAEPFTHWVLFNIPPTLPGLPEGVSKGPLPPEVPGAAQGVNDFGGIGYDGPAPPRGDGPHRYRFELYALDAMLDLPPGLTKIALRRTLEGHVLGKGLLTGAYSR